MGHEPWALRITVGAVALLACAAPQLLGQPLPPARFTLEGGMSAVEWTPLAVGDLGVSPRQSGATISPALRLGSDRVSLDVGGSWTSQPGGGSILVGGANAAAFTPRLGMLQGELHVAGSGNRLADGFASQRGAVGARLHSSAGRAGAWLGASAGRAGFAGSYAAVGSGDVGAWWSSGPLTLLLSATPTEVVRDTQQDRFADLEGGLRYATARFELGLAMGTRAAPSIGVAELGGATVWGSVATTWWASQAIGVTAAVGTYPTDVPLRFPGGRFASAGFRLAAWRADDDAPDSRARAAQALPSRRADVAGREPVVGQTLTMRRLSDSTEFTIDAAAAARVQIAGDFSNWAPVSLTRTNDARWRVWLPNLSAGAQQVAVRIDDGPWRAPAGLPVIVDEFGGESGLLVIDNTP